MTKENIQELAKLIRWIDQELFPDHPVPVYILPKRYLVLDRPIHSMACFVPEIKTRQILQTILTNVAIIFINMMAGPFEHFYYRFILRKPSPIGKHLKINFRMFKIIWDINTKFNNCYMVCDSADEMEFSLSENLALAAHEVRHRVQQMNAYGSETNESLKETFLGNWDGGYREDITAFGYHDNEMKDELDAYFIGEVMQRGFEAELENQAAGKDVREFIQENSWILKLNLS